MTQLAVALLALTLLAAPLDAGAQPARKVPRIGFLGPTSASAYGSAAGFEAFRQGLRDPGYVDGQTIIIECRWAEGKHERLPALAADLVRLQVDCIVTQGAGRLAAQRATATIPIVFALSPDPVGEGLVASLARPEGNLTGLSYMLSEAAVKRLELLKETIPCTSRVAVLFQERRQGRPYSGEDTRRLDSRRRRTPAEHAQWADLRYLVVYRSADGATRLSPPGTIDST